MYLEKPHTDALQRGLLSHYKAKVLTTEPPLGTKRKQSVTNLLLQQGALDQLGERGAFFLLLHFSFILLLGQTKADGDGKKGGREE